MKIYPIVIVLISVLFAACKPGLSPERLYGKWNYTRVEKPASPGDSITRFVIADEKPFIVFNKDNTLLIYWGGKVLSQGKFTTAGMDIKYREDLGDGKTRDFPFAVNELSDKKIIFETLGVDGSRVTAVRE
ncbi:hypothetical protein [Mucilaginibacter psychrotolerans]|uniref:Lipocalin-like domain-containing protein n=1 Tax=Mucilaginibacter psychrotolerans TaxID=1524096 RepID=A0A4Y8S376_9SPHI|nr:hypothetical protein [Mucilaginibacter psychrotolerans]TFF33448.1 hypothetical protein E2R66_25905 [Mucilaginibacter psychrotolerans]